MQTLFFLVFCGQKWKWSLTDQERIWNSEVAGASLLLVMSKPPQKLVWCSTLAATFISEINPSVFLIDDECICIFVICSKANIEVDLKLFCWATIWGHAFGRYDGAYL
jgi:hypothetical protein